MTGPINAKKVKQHSDRRQIIKSHESKTTPDSLKSIEPTAPQLTETPFEPDFDLHAKFISDADSDTRAANLVLGLQRIYGNNYVQRLVRSIRAQPKLTVSKPGDIYEQEADKVASLVTRKGTSPVQQQVEEEEEEGVQTKKIVNIRRMPEEEEEEVQTQLTNPIRNQVKEDDLQARSVSEHSTSVSNDLEKRINKAVGSGQTLPDIVREPMEQAIESDLSDVHVHTDQEADTLNKQLSAQAFTTGRDIFFKEGAYNPASTSGHELIAHELTHVVQQTGSNKRVKLTQSSLYRKTRTIQRALLPVQYRVLGTTREEFDGFDAETRVQIENLVSRGRLEAARQIINDTRAAMQGPPTTQPSQGKAPPRQGQKKAPPPVPPRHKVNVRRPPPPVPLPTFREVNFNPKEIPADGVTTTQAMVKTTPPNRPITWGFDGDNYNSKISPAGIITPGKNIGEKEKVKVKVKATDARLPKISSTGEFTLMESKYYQAIQDYVTFIGNTYEFKNFQIGVNGLFDMEYQPQNKIAAVTLKVKFDIKDDPKKNDSLFDQLQRKLNYPYYREQFRDIVTDAWSQRYRFKNIREPKNVWGKLNPVSVPVNVSEVNAGEHFLIKLDLTQEKGAAVGKHKGKGYARLYKGSLEEKKAHFQNQVERGENDRIKVIAPGASNGSPAIEFDRGSKDIKKGDKERLNFMATYLRSINIPPFDVKIEGHSINSNETSRFRSFFGGLVGAKSIVSRQRAAAVEAYLKAVGGVGIHKLATNDAGPTGAAKVVVKPQIQDKFENMYITTAHEVGHMFGLADEYPGPGTAYGHHGLVKKAFGLKYADALVSPPADKGQKGRFADVMSNGRDVRMHNYVTFWEALCETTTQKAAVPAKKFGEADWKFVGYS